MGYATSSHAASPGAEVDLAPQRIGAPIAKPYKVIGIGLSYADHADESALLPALAG